MSSDDKENARYQFNEGAEGHIAFTELFRSRYVRSQGPSVLRMGSQFQISVRDQVRPQARSPFARQMSLRGLSDTVVNVHMQLSLGLCR